LAQNGIGCVATWDADWDGKVSLRDRAVPDFVTAFALANQRTAGAPQKVAQRSVKLRGHHAAAGSASRSAVICK
jgi:hypothetical protein